MLITLGYRVPRDRLDDLLGSVVAYPLTGDFHDAWDALPARSGPWRQHYKALAMGLTAATGRPVRLFADRHLAEVERAGGTRMLLLTTDAALDYRLRVAVRAWERHITDGAPSTLAELLPPPGLPRPFADYFHFRDGQVPVMPDWVFRTAAWQFMRELAGHPMPMDDRSPLALRMDTDGSLLAWNTDDLIVNRTGKAFSMARVTARLITRAGVEDPVLSFDAHLSRLSPQGHHAKHAWVERGDPQAPILRLRTYRTWDPKEEEWHTQLDPAIAQILGACQLEPLHIPVDLPSVPGQIRPQLSQNRFTSLGSGLGPRFMLRLHEHICRTFPALVPLTYHVDKAIRLPQRVTKYQDGGVPATGIGPTGYRRVTLACLYSTTQARDRMLGQLAALAGRPVRPAPGGAAVPINDRLEVVTRHCPDLLAHTTVNRAGVLGAALDLPPDEDRLVAAWLETEHHPAVDRPEFDAKPHARRLLGHLRIPSQFLATDPVDLPPDAEPRSASEQEHAGRAALRDLFRAAGVLDDRLPNALGQDGLLHRLDRPALLVGIHMRRQQKSGDGLLMTVTMYALHTHPTDLGLWRALMYSDRKGAWLRAADALTDFHAGPIGTHRFGRSGPKAEVTRAEVEQRLQALVASVAGDVPVVVFVEAGATRSIWPGLADNSFGAGPVPGDALHRDGVDVAVVRLNTKPPEIGRPVTRVEKANNPADPRQPAAPERKIYRLVESSLDSWYLPGRSVSLKAKRGDRGARHTRWTLPADLGSELTVPWHAYTGKEILVVRAGSWPSAQLAALTARLCEQAVSWDGRTTVPVPLHLAMAADRDHPDYRVSGAADGDHD